MTRYHFRKNQGALGLSAHSAPLRGSSASYDTNSITWKFPTTMVSSQGKSARITLPSSMKYRSMGGIPPTVLTPEIAHPRIYSLLNTISIIIYIPILITVALLLAVTLASSTVSTAVSTSASTIVSTTTPTSCALLLGLPNFGLITRMQAIWRVVFASIIITWDFSFGKYVPMVRWNVPIIGKI